jgi:hypothetical protein
MGSILRCPPPPPVSDRLARAPSKIGWHSAFTALVCDTRSAPLSFRHPGFVVRCPLSPPLHHRQDMTTFAVLQVTTVRPYLSSLNEPIHLHKDVRIRFKAVPGLSYPWHQYVHSS